MKAINVTELKARLSMYLRMASRGFLILVKDRDEPIAQLGPPQAGRDLGPTAWPRQVGSVWARKTGVDSRSPGSIGSSTFRHRFVRFARIRVKYVDASAVLRVLFADPGPEVPLGAGDRVVSSARGGRALPGRGWTHDDRQATAALSRGLTVRGT